MCSFRDYTCVTYFTLVMLNSVCYNVTAKTILKALYDYDPRQSDDLGFKKGDRLELLSDRCVAVMHSRA